MGTQDPDRLGVPPGLRDLGLPESALDEATDLVLAKVPADNPRPLDRDDVAGLLRRAWAGRPGSTATGPHEEGSR